MRYLLRTQEIRHIEAELFENQKTNPYELMDKIGLSISEFLIENYPLSKQRILILCGAGNNGGDGLSVAKFLAKKNIIADICLLFPEKEKTLENLKQLQELEQVKSIVFISIGDLILQEYDLIIDAIFGIGFNRQLNSDLIELFQNINQAKSKKIAIDIPSALNADNGLAHPIAIKADITVCIAYLKVGLLHQEGPYYAGKIKMILDKFGRNDNRVASAHQLVKRNQLVKLLPKRKVHGNKYDFGKVLIIGGSSGMVGAPILAGLAAMTVGAGIVKVLLPDSCKNQFQLTHPELIYDFLNTDWEQITKEDQTKLGELIEWADGIALGMGIGQSRIIGSIIKQLIQSKKKICFDADALQISFYNDINNSSQEIVITPHLGEFCRFFSIEKQSLKENFLQLIEERAQHFKKTFALKGPTKIINDAQAKIFWHMRKGNVSLAKAGTGDLLAGITATFLAQGLTGVNAAILANYIHSMASDIYLKMHDPYSLTATRLLKYIQKSMEKLYRESKRNQSR